MGWLGGEVAFLGSDLVTGVEGLEVDGSECAVLFEVGGAVDEGVLAAELFLDVAEADGYVLDLDGEEGAAASGVGDLLEDLVAFVFAGADVGADGVDDGFGALALLDGVAHTGSAVVVVAVGDKDEGAANGSGLLQRKHLVATGFVESVEESGTATGTESADALIQEVNVVSEVLGDISLDVEAFNKGAVVAVKYLKKELDSGVLLELEALTNGTRGVEHDADTQRKIGLLGEAEYGKRRTAIIEQAEVLALEAGNELALLVGDGEDEIDFVDLDFDGLGGLLLRGLSAGLLDSR